MRLKREWFQHQVTGFGSVDRRHKRFFIAQLTDQDDIGVFTHRVFHTDLKVNNVLADFALVDQTLIFGVHKLDRSSSVRMCLR